MGKNAQVVDRIAWHEGMLLAPQHFQQLSARVDSLVAAQTLAAQPLAWGLSHLVLDEQLLPVGRLRVLELEAVLADGTLVSYSALVGTPLEVDLGPFESAMQQEGVDVYLTLALGQRRFISAAVSVEEDLVSDAPDAEVPRWVPDLQLLAGEAPGPDRTGLLLGNFVQEGSTVKRGLRLGPLLHLPRDGEPYRQAVAVLARIRAKAVYLAKQTLTPVSDLESRLAQAEQRGKLMALMAALPGAEGVLRLPRLHPCDLYLALVTLSGPMALLCPGQVAPIPPDYDHERPQAALDPLLRFLNEMAAEVSEAYRLSKFVLVDGVFELRLESTLEQELLVGVMSTSERAAIAWMSGAVIGDQSEFPALRGRRVLGAAREPVGESGSMRYRNGYALFRIDAATLRSGGMLHIANSNEGALAERPSEIVLFTQEDA